MRTVIVAILAGAIVTAHAPGIDDATRVAMANRVAGGHTLGIEVGLATADGRTFASQGSIARGAPSPTKDTVFEIGSITKVFTALLLTDMIERREVALDDPVSKYLPPSVTVPARNGRAITLADLTTHTSGLPRVPRNLDSTHLENPYATYDAAKLYAFLAGYQLTRDPGAQWEYSNVGAGLLGHALACHAGMSYEQLVKTRILDPLGMMSTTITLTADQRRRLATAYDETLHAVSFWDFDALAGAGALRSTADDLLTFAAAAAGLIDTPLKTAMDRMRALRRPGPAPGMGQAMGWQVLKATASDVFLHDGGTRGFRSAIVVDPSHKRAAVAWANAPLDVTELAVHLVEPRSPLATLDPVRIVVRLDEERLASYVGVYQFTPSFSIHITREGDRIFEQATNQARFEIFADKTDEFSLRVVKAQISFVRDSSGKVVALVLHQNGIDQRAPKVPSP
jgi:CubicO group peptidase (beta-lactamase class C family)